MTQPAAPDLLDRLAHGWRGFVIAALIGLLSALPGIARLPVMDRDEARYVQATTQMLETGDYVRIFVQDTPRNKKPIGIYWLQAASVGALSDAEARAVWAYRLPSALAAALAAMAAFWMGTALLSRRAALIGAALFGAGLLIGFEGMTAKTDAALCATITLALAALAHMRAGSARPKALALIFWLAIGAGILIKGPVAPLAAALALAALGLWERRWAWMRAAPWPLAIGAALLLVAPWMIAIGIATNGAFFIEAIGVDLAPKLAGQAEGHSGPLGYYLLALPLLAFPLTFLLPAAGRLIWRVARADRAGDNYQSLRFLIAASVPLFLVMEALPTKLAHYTLPTYPALALIAAAAWDIARAERWTRTMAAGLALFALSAIALAAFVAYAATYMPGDAIADQRRLLQGLVIGGAALAPALGAMLLLRAPSARLGLAVLVALTISFALRERILPEARELLASSEVSRALDRAELHPRLDAPAPPLIIVGYGETSLVFETDTDVRIANPEEAAARAAPGATMIVERRAASALDGFLARRNLAREEATAPVSGLNYANGDEIVLEISRVAVAR